MLHLTPGAGFLELRGIAHYTISLQGTFTNDFPGILQELGASLLVTSHQASRLVIMDARDGQFNLQWHRLAHAAGLDLQEGRLAIGSELQIREFQAFRSADTELFLPRITHVTGDINIHELAWASGTLWFVNTAYSCLCTNGSGYHFVPRWRPRFVSALEPEDRCHLNCLAVVDGQPRYVTAFAETDTRDGWRPKRTESGIIIDITTDEVMTRGLSMPHSPRWHKNKLWVLSSGDHTLGVIDGKSGKYQVVIRLPGFTRGLDLVGHYAFVGVSKGKDCGVWIVDIRSGKSLACVKFEADINEVFAVKVALDHRAPTVCLDARRVKAEYTVFPTKIPALPRQVRGGQSR